MNHATATASGVIAIALWSLLALFTAAAGAIPPFQLTAICFAIATAIGLAVMLKRGQSRSLFRQPLSVWLLGTAGLFGYHFFYFTALQNAPPAEASLIAYLWPLLIVLFSALLPGEKLRWFHIAGAVLGLVGLTVLVTRGGVSFEGRFAFGYGIALICAFVWSGYSVLSRRFADVPSDIVTGYCLVSAILAALAHLAFESTVWPTGGMQWLAVIMLGLGPVGAAFYVWDHGMKHGNIQLLGAASYATPVLSVFVLIAFGYAEWSWHLMLAPLLVTCGAVVAAGVLFKARSARQS
ncbi:MAG: EamA family transporter [Ahrensia sp.]|nr:EamA family transporter [Ahrensia sp.]